MLTELRAQGWKYASLALAVLAVIAIVAALCFRGDSAISDARAQQAESERDSARAEVNALKAARDRDDRSADFSQQANQQVEQHTAESNERLTRVEVEYRDRIVEVPAACPGPDPDLMRDLQEQGRRLSASEGRMRAVRTAGQAHTSPARPR